MKKAKVNWKKVILTDAIIKKMADLYLEEYEWHQIAMVSRNPYELEMICHFLLQANIISANQFGIWAARKEWTNT